jgi:hypothetical protein
MKTLIYILWCYEQYSFLLVCYGLLYKLLCNYVKPKIHKNVIVQTFCKRWKYIHGLWKQGAAKNELHNLYPLQNLIKQIKKDDKVNGECSMPNEYEQCIPSFCQTTRMNDVNSDIWMYIRR